MYKSEARSNPGAQMGRRWWKEYSGGREGRRFGKQRAHRVMRRDAVRVIHTQLEGQLERGLSKKPGHQYLLVEECGESEFRTLDGASPTLKHAQRRVVERLKFCARLARLRFDPAELHWEKLFELCIPRLPYPYAGNLSMRECERLEIHRVQVQATEAEEFRG